MATNKIDVAILASLAPSLIEFAEALKKVSSVFDVSAVEPSARLLSNDEYDLIVSSFENMREQIAVISLVKELKRLWEE